MQRLILIDGHAILHRAYHALPPLTNERGELTNAVYGFLSMMLRVVNDFHPTHLVVTFDRPAPTFRKKMYKEYQSHRPKMEDGLSSQIVMVHDVLREMGIQMSELDGYEADDVIGTIAESVKGKALSEKREEQETIIVTGDRDILQLVDEHTRVYMPVKGLSEGVLYGEKEVEVKFGVRPDQIDDYKALVGDASDNYPGVPGIGPKTASTLLQEHQTLEGIYAHLDSIRNESVRKKLLDHRESALMSQKLATIMRDVPVDFSAAQCLLPRLDNEHTVRIFEERGFRSLIPRLSGAVREKKKTGNSGENPIKSEQTSLF